uniref:Putative secreted protein n=1 Tax=Ixodes ricinus TaxID=34613 RepID=A0A6B0UKQ9_IXORI
MGQGPSLAWILWWLRAAGHIAATPHDTWRRSRGGRRGRLWFPVVGAHVLHQGFSVDADLVADRARLRRRSSDQRRVLLGSVSPQTAIRREALAANVAVEGSALGTFHLAVMIS